MKFSAGKHIFIIIISQQSKSEGMDDFTIEFRDQMFQLNIRQAREKQIAHKVDNKTSFIHWTERKL